MNKVHSIIELEFFKKLVKLSFVEAVYLYGSRARKDHQERSDIDLAIVCPAATAEQWLLVEKIIDEADTLLKIDYVRLDELDKQDPLKQNILQDKLVLFERENMTTAEDQNFKDLGEALERLKEALQAAPDKNRFVIDSTIHRFEFCIQLFWKNFKNLLKTEGKEALSPKESISQAYMMKWFDNETIWLSMLKDRNLTSHTYKVVNADVVYERIKQYYPELQKTYDFLKKKYNKT